MPDPDTLHALRLRVEAASGPDQHLDDAVLFALEEKWNVNTPRYTASLDAALALVRRKLPGWGGTLHWQADGRARAVLMDETGFRWGALDCASDALAAIAALLHVLEEQER